MQLFVGADEELTHLAEKTLTQAAFKATAVCAGYLPIHVGAVLPQQVGQFRISANSSRQQIDHRPVVLNDRLCFPVITPTPRRTFGSSIQSAP